MAGKMCLGRNLGNSNIPRKSKAYAEGRHAASMGMDIDTNPHTGQGDPVALSAWYGGWYSYYEGAPQFFIKDCAADTKGGGWDDPSQTWAVDASEASIDGAVDTWYPITFTVTLNGEPAPFFRVGVQPRDNIEFEYVDAYWDGLTDENGQVTVQFLATAATSTTLVVTASNGSASVPATFA